MLGDLLCLLGAHRMRLASGSSLKDPIYACTRSGCGHHTDEQGRKLR